MESTYEENSELSSRGGNQAVAPQSAPKEALAMGIRPPDTKKHGASARAEKTPEEKKTKRCGTSTEKNRHYAPEERKKQMTGRREGGIAPPSEHVTTPSHLNQPKLRVATYNVAGLKMDLTISEHYCRKSKALLSWARDQKLDVLFIQEHNCGKNEFGRMKILANLFGYSVTMASRRQTPGEEESSRGGAAILTRKLSFPAGAEDDEYQETHGGRLARRTVVWEDMVIELASTYIPASARERKIFLNKLLHDNPLNRDTIVGGDFNCVIDVNKDVCYATGVDGTYRDWAGVNGAGRG